MSPHAPSLYAATADAALAFPTLTQSVRAHVAIIGGGYTGLSAALHLAERGIDVVLVEAERVGWGASGRNGGQLHSGQRRDQDWLEARLGTNEARRLWNLAEDAKALTLGLIERHMIDCDWRAGLIETVHKRRLVAGEIAYVEKLRRDYAYSGASWLDRDALAAAIGTGVYFGGRRDTGAGHLDPLKFAQGLARAAARAGARIFEGTRATRITGTAATGFKIDCLSRERHPRESGDPVNASAEDKAQGRRLLDARPVAGMTTTGRGTITADIALLAGNGYLDGIDAEVEARVLPIDNYILATEPIGAGRAGGLIASGEAVSDTRFVVYYFRPSPEGRLIFGGGETYSRRPPVDMAAFVRSHMLRIYKQLAGTRIDHAWGGTLAVTRHRLPFIRRVRPGVYAAAGYSGQGVALAPFAGKIIADAIAGDPGRLDLFAALPVPRFPGGRWLRKPVLAAGMTWYALRDRL